MRVLLIVEADVDLAKFSKQVHDGGELRPDVARDVVRHDVRRALRSALPYANDLEVVYIPELLPTPVAADVA